MTHRSTAGELPRVVLCGAPNVGKSSLFNALAGADRAIVSPVAGTTRDYLTARLMLGGMEFELIDTAGVERATAASLAEAAQAATAASLKRADLRVLCVDPSLPTPTMPPLTEDLPTIVVRTKADLRATTAAPFSDAATGRELDISVFEGTGLDELRRALALALAERSTGDVVASTAVRCGESLRRAGEALAEAEVTAATGGADELTAAALRYAMDELGQVVGAVYTEDILDRIFSRFCIGK